jgi:hypothetical protein
MLHHWFSTGLCQMIIKRFTQAVREQSWFTVVLEIAIVVIGIFIGLQVDDWNQRRVERENDQRALALFIDELQLMLDEASVDVKFVTAFMQDLSSGTEIALKCDASDAERARLLTAIGNTLDWRVPDVRPAGLAEIGNSGTLARLGNPDLSRAVGTINQNIKSIEDSMDLIASQYDRAWQMLLPYLVLTKPIKLEKLELGVLRQIPNEYMVLVPQETLCSSQEFLLGLSLLTAFYESNVYNFDAWHSALTTAYELAVAETG